MAEVYLGHLVQDKKNHLILLHKSFVAIAPKLQPETGMMVSMVKALKKKANLPNYLFWYDNKKTQLFVSTVKMQIIQIVFLATMSIHNINYVCFKYHQMSHVITSNMSHLMRKLAFCICENKDADQLRGNREADQRLCFRYRDSTIPLLPTSEISSL